MTRDFPDVFSFSFFLTSFCQQENSFLIYNSLMGLDDVVKLLETLFDSILSMKRGLVFCLVFVLGSQDLFLFICNRGTFIWPR